MKAIDSVRTFIVENFLYGEYGQVGNDTSFLESRTIDSMGVLELVSFLEYAFDIRVEDDELVPENLDSLQNIERYLEHKLNGNSP